MILKKIINSIFLTFFAYTTLGQNHYKRFETIDVQHYVFELHLSDTSNIIEGKTLVSTLFLKPDDRIVFDLIGIGEHNKGMQIDWVKHGEEKLEFTHNEDQLEIQLGRKTQKNEHINFEIKYSGIPSDGLVIDKNKYGERTFFGDNWPDRAKYWLPTIDHPSDKATLEFKVYAPEHYEVISNGLMVDKKQLQNEIEFTHWKEDVPISTKLMVIGVANFVFGNQTVYKNIPVSSWVFRKNKTKGLENYKYGAKALEYFSELIGPYSFEKLAHVQSKTRYGGMENAGCIFYHERTAISDRSQEGLFAHEVAHQWFGNSVTEQNWHHIWLSEGFATYLTHIYNQHFYGYEVLRDGLKKDRERVIRFSKQHLAPIIDTTVTDYIRLLNANSYQKASWFLHMLRINLGDEIFFNGLRKYYSDYRNSTTLTKDFRRVMEAVSDKDLHVFFKQWLWQAGHPVLDFNWEQKENRLSINFKQMQKNIAFTFPIDVELHFTDGTSKLETIQINSSDSSFVFDTDKKLKYIVLDPEVKLLFEIH